jgi:tetrahydromethanopterin S-methyltransferase subunit G
MLMDDQRASVFVKVDEYKAIRELLDSIRQRLAQAKSLLARVNELKQKEDAQIESWARDLEDVEERLASVDKSLLEPQA